MSSQSRNSRKLCRPGNLVAVASLIVGLAVTADVPAEASDPCAWDGILGSPYNQNKFTGQVNSNNAQGGVEGISASVRAQATHVCTTSTSPGNSASAWVMIAEDNAHAANRCVYGGIAQVGFMQDPQHTTPWYFYEGGPNDSGPGPSFWGTVNPGVSTGSGCSG